MHDRRGARRHVRSRQLRVHAEVQRQRPLRQRWLRWILWQLRVERVVPGRILCMQGQRLWWSLRFLRITQDLLKRDMLMPGRRLRQWVWELPITADLLRRHVFVFR